MQKSSWNNDFLSDNLQKWFKRENLIILTISSIKDLFCEFKFKESFFFLNPWCVFIQAGSSTKQTKPIYSMGSSCPMRLSPIKWCRTKLRLLIQCG